MFPVRFLPFMAPQHGGRGRRRKQRAMTGPLEPRIPTAVTATDE